MASSNKQTAVRLVLVILAALTLFALITYYNRARAPERFSALKPVTRHDDDDDHVPVPAPSHAGPAATAHQFEPSANEALDNEKYLPVKMPDGGPSEPDAHFPQDRIKPEDLLPRDAANSKWSQVNPAGQGSLSGQNYLSAAYHLGVDTQGSSLRNPSYDLRTEPPNPRYKVSIWNSSTIDPDMHRKPLE